MKRIRPSLAPFLFSILISFPLSLTGQEEGSQEAQAIEAVESVGGRVYRISAADSSREISFALSDKSVTDAQMEQVSKIDNVIWLNLAGTEISNDGLQQLAGMPLEKLHLEKTKISDDGLKHLKGFKKLYYLNLYDTQVGDAGLDHLAGLENLKKLYVWKSKVTDAGMKKLKKALPAIEIVGELKLAPVPKPEPKKKEPAKKKAKPKKKKPNAKAADKKDKSKKKEPSKENPNSKDPSEKPAPESKKKDS